MLLINTSNEHLLVVAVPYNKIKYTALTNIIDNVENDILMDHEYMMTGLFLHPEMRLDLLNHCDAELTAAVYDTDLTADFKIRAT